MSNFCYSILADADNNILGLVTLKDFSRVIIQIPGLSEFLVLTLPKTGVTAIQGVCLNRPIKKFLIGTQLKVLRYMIG